MANTRIEQGSNRVGSVYAENSYVIIGNNSGDTTNLNAAARASSIAPYSKSWRRPVATFVKRPTLHQKLKQQLHDHINTVSHDDLVALVIVYGLGGVGKSQLVSSYLQEYQDDYSALFWIEAGSRQSIERDYVGIYRRLFNAYTIKETDLPKVEDIILAVKSWFHRKDGRWLFIFDSADAISEEEDEHSFDIMQYLLDAPKVQTIITTRSSIAKDIPMAVSIEVGRMELSEASELFMKSAKLKDLSQESEVEVKAIVKELGCLALAVNLAGYYVSQTPRIASDLGQYLIEYCQRRKELLSQKPRKVIHQYGESVLTTWETSYRAIERRCRPAAQFLALLSCLNSDDIFMGLICNVGYDVAHTLSCPFMVAPEEMTTTYNVEDYLRILQEYSLLQWRQDQNSYSMHKLVHAWGYDRLALDEQGRYSYTALQLIVQVIPDEQADLAPKLRIIPHVIANFSNVSRAWGAAGLDDEGALSLLFTTGGFLRDIGKYAEALVVQTFLVKGCSDILGGEHLTTIWAMNNLASLLSDQGKLDEAVSMQIDVLETCTRTFGGEYPDTIWLINNLAIILEKYGRLDDAELMQKDVLEKITRTFGREHPHTIWVINNLAYILRDQGKLDEAASMQIDVLKKSTRVLGGEHPYTIMAMENLASTLRAQGKLDEAASMEIDVLEKRTRILGGKHLDTIMAMENLARTLRDHDKLDEAASMRKDVLEKCIRNLGEEHPDTIGAMSNLACTLRDQGKLDEAASMEIDVLEKSIRNLGKEHPNTIGAMSNLASTLRAQGKLDEAASMEIDVLEKRTRILGGQHPDTIMAMENLARTLRDHDKLDEAASMRKDVLEKCIRNLGEEHPDTIGAMSNLACTLRAQGKLDEAASMQIDVLEKSIRILGKEHPNTIGAIIHLASTLGDQGKLDEAASLKIDILEKCIRNLGKEHPDTIGAMNNLACTLRAQGKLDEAASMQIDVLEKCTRVLGGEHPKTILAMINFASTLEHQGKLDEAELMRKDVLEKITRTFGREHSKIVWALNNLHHILAYQGKLDETALM
ncbi:MAG: Kinesin light chain 3 [Vezdaea acicularis]|nr:MAG: Kinesin light chain 3 [Vezdaea acicularis]